MRYPVWSLLHAGLVSVLAFVFVGCSGEVDVVPERVDDDAEAVAVMVAEDAIRERARELLETEGDRLHAELLAAGGLADALERVLTDRAEHVPLRRRLFLAHLYEGRDHRPIFFRYGAPTHRVDAMIEAIAQVMDQGVDPAQYLTVALRDALAVQARVGAVWQNRPSLGLEGEVLEVVRDRVEGLDVPADGTTDDRARRLARAALASALEGGGEESGVLADLRALHAAKLQQERERRGADAVAEALLADTFLRYAFDMRHANVRMFRGNVTEEERRAIVAERMEGAFVALAEAGDAEAVRSLVLDELRPQHQQYAPLMAERRRYAAIVAAGGWPEVRPFEASRGRSHPRIPLLRERLRIEGYYTAEIPESGASDRFDAALEQAIRAYQETHQMDVTGGFYTMFWQSLNISAEHRLAQIDLTLERWRESMIGDEDFFVFVNIPDFHAEVWNAGVRDMRFGVVVGNNRMVCNPRTRQMEMINATPVDSFRMTYMVLNPYWYIPRRIVEDDLLPQLLEDPTFFERMGYERYVTADGVELVRQIPGDNNALGRIKFMFPNQHNVYMHDTPQQALFGREIRQASSGCVRLSRPMEFMQYILERDGQWDERRIQRIFDSMQETGIVLRNSVPVYFEYYVVRVDDEGRANFLADVYRLDRRRMDPNFDPNVPCDPPSRGEHRIVLSEDGRAMLRDSEGNVFDPEELNAAPPQNGEAPPELIDAATPPAGGGLQGEPPAPPAAEPPAAPAPPDAGE